MNFQKNHQTNSKFFFGGFGLMLNMGTICSLTEKNAILYRYVEVLGPKISCQKSGGHYHGKHSSET